MDYSAFIMLGIAAVGAIGTYYITSFKVEQQTTQIDKLAAEVHQLQLDAARDKAEKAEIVRNLERFAEIAKEQQQNYQTLLTRLGQIDGKLSQILNK